MKLFQRDSNTLKVIVDLIQEQKSKTRFCLFKIFMFSELGILLRRKCQYLNFCLVHNCYCKGCLRSQHIGPLSILLSRCFLGIASLFFSKFWHGARNPHEVVHGIAGFSRNKILPQRIEL